MAHAGLFATLAECTGKAGANYNSTAVDEAAINGFCLQAENLINCISRYDWSSHFTAPATTTTLSANVWHFLGEIESNLVGMYMIQHDMSGYTSRTEAEDMINVLRDAALRGLSILRDKKAQDFMTGVTP